MATALRTRNAGVWTAAAIAVTVMVGAGVVRARPSEAAFRRCWMISGYVRDGLLRPLAGAVVGSANPSADCPPGSVVTGDDGRYEISVEGNDVGAGAIVTASHAGYASNTHEADAGALAPPLAGTAGVPTSNDFHLSR